MSNSNKTLVILASVAFGCLTLVSLGVGWMQYVSFRNEQEKIAQEKEIAAQRDAAMAVSAECRELALLVNQTQDFMQSFESEIQSFSESAAQVKNLNHIKTAANQYTTAVSRVVKNLDGLEEDLQTISLKGGALIQFRDRYVEVVQGFSTSLQDASQAMDLVVTVGSTAELPARIEQSQQRTMAAVASIEELSDQESNLISDVNAFCEETNIKKLELQTGS